MKRQLDIIVLSDLHLGTFGCKDKELELYLSGVDTKTLILNGDIIDCWQFQKSLFPKKHKSILSQLIQMMNEGTKIYYICGNHDDMLREFPEFSLGGLSLVSQEIKMTIGGKEVIFIHGDIFDKSVNGIFFRKLAILGGYLYDLLIMANTLLNKLLYHVRMENVNISKFIKSLVKKTVISKYEQKALQYASDFGADAIVVGHVHSPEISMHPLDGKEIRYLNSGDWIEHMTSLEYTEKEGWQIYKHK